MLLSAGITSASVLKVPRLTPFGPRISIVLWVGPTDPEGAKKTTMSASLPGATGPSGNCAMMQLQLGTEPVMRRGSAVLLRNRKVWLTTPSASLILPKFQLVASKDDCARICHETRQKSSKTGSRHIFDMVILGVICVSRSNLGIIPFQGMPLLSDMKHLDTILHHHALHVLKTCHYIITALI